MKKKTEHKRRERIANIISILRLNRAATIHELAEKLKVSEMTVRRDLQLLAGDNIVKIVHAGAVLNPDFQPDITQPRYSLTEAGSIRAEEKRRIGLKASSLIESEDIVIIDSGSTTEYVAKSIPADLPLTLICFALNILVEAHRNEECKLIFAGGALHENTLMFESPEGVQLVRRYRANKAFISASGVSDKLGVTCANTYEVETKKAALSSALYRILLVDSSKFGKVRAAYFADIEDFDLIITDTGISPEQREILEKLGAELCIV